MDCFLKQLLSDLHHCSDQFQSSSSQTWMKKMAAQTDLCWPIYAFLVRVQYGAWKLTHVSWLRHIDLNSVRNNQLTHLKCIRIKIYKTNTFGYTKAHFSSTTKEIWTTHASAKGSWPEKMSIWELIKLYHREAFFGAINIPRWKLEVSHSRNSFAMWCPRVISMTKNLMSSYKTYIRQDKNLRPHFWCLLLITIKGNFDNTHLWSYVLALKQLRHCIQTPTNYCNSEKKFSHLHDWMFNTPTFATKTAMFYIYLNKVN